ncbi:predicted protein [Nematostella vectensis]|uniref:Uncharacterized protein n=1 Tax=Nematostella vectensis TaxID=45351 RepID=A7T4E2_NEMVE|nr:predicted protein [Nematostella vectensis]|eukprot:XP_001621268.1 hypothetical protein NEMVEDRAFT_v1g222174 [Nematostella vectensis]
MAAMKTTPGLVNFFIFNSTYGPREGETISIPFSEKIAKDGKNTIEYHYDDVLDNVLDAVLKQSYKMFKLFNGPFNYLSETYGREALKKRSEYFFLSYLQTLNFSSFDLLDIFAGIQFLPLDKNTFLKIQSFVNLIEHTFSQIKYTAFLYSDKLVW